VRLWLDARASGPDELDRWWEDLLAEARALEESARVDVEAAVSSFNRGTTFDPGVRRALTEAAVRAGLRAPELICFAGHDAGVVAERRPAGMVLVRNRTGVSHTPDEEVDLEDAAAAANVLAAAVEALA
jgi:N-carbamoyl-L-amino-acid hydrolase